MSTAPFAPKWNVKSLALNYTFLEIHKYMSQGTQLTWDIGEIAPIACLISLLSCAITFGHSLSKCGSMGNIP